MFLVSYTHSGTCGPWYHPVPLATLEAAQEVIRQVMKRQELVVTIPLTRSTVGMIDTSYNIEPTVRAWFMVATRYSYNPDDCARYDFHVVEVPGEGA